MLKETSLKNFDKIEVIVDFSVGIVQDKVKGDGCNENKKIISPRFFRRFYRFYHTRHKRFYYNKEVFNIQNSLKDKLETKLKSTKIYKDFFSR